MLSPGNSGRRAPDACRWISGIPASDAVIASCSAASSRESRAIACARFCRVTGERRLAFSPSRVSHTRPLFEATAGAWKRSVATLLLHRFHLQQRCNHWSEHRYAMLAAASTSTPPASIPVAEADADRPHRSLLFCSVDTNTRVAKHAHSVVRSVTSTRAHRP